MLMNAVIDAGFKVQVLVDPVESPNHDLEVREMLASGGDKLVHFFPVTEGDDQQLGLFGSRRFQQVVPVGIAVESLDPDFSEKVDVIRIAVDDGDLNLLGAKYTAHVISKPSETRRPAPR